jgi:hypothetical protein
MGEGASSLLSQTPILTKARWLVDAWAAQQRAPNHLPSKDLQDPVKYTIILGSKLKSTARSQKFFEISDSTKFGGIRARVDGIQPGAVKDSRGR